MLWVLSVSVAILTLIVMYLIRSVVYLKSVILNHRDALENFQKCLKEKENSLSTPIKSGKRTMWD